MSLAAASPLRGRRGACWYRPPAPQAPRMQPEAQASKACGAVKTRNGGRARSIAATGGTSCRTARRVASRARGRRYRAFGYRCVPDQGVG